jgi:hypothetical protein
VPFHQFDEALEVMIGVVRAGRGFGMILHRDYWQRFVAQAFDAAIVQIYMRYLHVRRQTVCLDRESMIV